MSSENEEVVTYTKPLPDYSLPLDFRVRLEERACDDGDGVRHYFRAVLERNTSDIKKAIISGSVVSAVIPIERKAIESRKWVPGVEKEEMPGGVGTTRKRAWYSMQEQIMLELSNLVLRREERVYAKTEVVAGGVRQSSATLEECEAYWAQKEGEQ